MTLTDILQRLDGVKGADGKYMAKCPNHPDSTPSLSVSVGDGGRILLKCFAGCKVEDIVWAMGLTMNDLFAEDSIPAKKQADTATKEAEYIYAGGQLKKVKYRRPDGSKFCPWKHLVDGRWEKGREGIAPGLYQSHTELPEIFFLVEGEKDVENLKKAGLVAVSLPDGSQSKWEAAYDSVFRGKQVVILPDNDQPGQKYAQMCAGKLHGNAEKIWVVDLKQAWPDIPEKGDISDLLLRFGEDAAMQKVMDVLHATPEWSPPAAEPDKFLSLFKPLTDFQEEEATWLIPGWVPEGQITLIAADGGVGKTTLWCNIMASLSAGRPCILDPDGYQRKPQKVAFCTTEDSVRKKLLKKLRQAGANMENIIAMDMAADKDGSLRNFKFGSTQMERFVKYFKPAACAFDPVQGFIPAEINMGSRNAMRDCMAPLISLGEDTGTTFLVICHTNKRKGASGRDRIADSADLWDIARSVIMAGYTESQGVRYLSNEKNNYAQLRETVLFSINDAGQIVKEGTSWKRDKDYMTESAAASSKPAQDDCRGFILELLQAAPDHRMKTNELIAEAEKHGHSYGTFKRAKATLTRENMIVNESEGSSRNGSKVFYTKLRFAEADDFHELPFDVPTPFDATSA